MSKLVVIVQCDAVQKRCAGYFCTKSFYNKTGVFGEYPEDTQYMTFTCGGCCGVSLAAKLESLTKKRRICGEKKEDVTVHFSSCIVSDNYHTPPCPHVEYMKEIVRKKGYTFAAGSYICKQTEAKRKAGLYGSFTDKEVICEV